jgi:S-adenosylmethionine/arginine decarboxylase-like enzyme
VTKLLEHKRLIVRAEVKNPPKDPRKMEAWMSAMVAALGMKELAPSRAIYSDMVGNRGLTCDVLLNTSNACVHTWDEVDPALFMLDVYSCGPLDPTVIFKLLQEFEPIKANYMLIDQEYDLVILEQGTYPIETFNTQPL